MYEQYTKLIATHELWFLVIVGMLDIGTHTKLGHGHLLSVWKAPLGPETLEISHDSGFHTERPETPIELG